MDCPTSNTKIQSQLCDLLYPYGCGARCKNLYKHWIETEEEVRKLEGLENKNLEVCKNE